MIIQNSRIMEFHVASKVPPVSDSLQVGEQTQSSVLAAEQQIPSAAPLAQTQERLDEVEEIDFLLEEIENKIAPLALA
jgi:hypothetical protein